MIGDFKFGILRANTADRSVMAAGRGRPSRFVRSAFDQKNRCTWPPSLYIDIRGLENSMFSILYSVDYIY